jgi:ParB family chromosome partitioning protein
MPKKTETKYEKGKLYEVPVSDLKPDENQPRKHMDPLELAGLKESINMQGLLQPIIFRKDGKDGLTIVSGERRYAAYKELGRKKIQGMFTDGDPMEIALIENLVREDLTPVAKAEALKKLQKERKYEQKELATMFGKSESTISEILSLNNLPAKIKKECIGDHKYALRRLKRIATQKNAKKMQKMFNEYKKQLNKTAEDRKTGTRSSIQVEMKRLNTTRQRLIKFKDKWNDRDKSKGWDSKEKKEIKAELLNLRNLIDEILGKEK